MKGLEMLPIWKTVPAGAWIASHVLIILGVAFATICVYSILPHGLARFAPAAIWCIAGGLCFVFASGFAKLASK